MTTFARIWHLVLDGITWILTTLNAFIAAIPVIEVWSWGLAIVALTILVRIALIPVIVKQVRFAKVMEECKPELAQIKARNRTDRRLLRSDPREYKDRRSRKQEEEARLYKDRGVNPLGGLVPPLVQIAVFIVVFRVLGDAQRLPELRDASFAFTHDLIRSAVAHGIADISAWVLVALVGVTTYIGQKQNIEKGPTSMRQRTKLFLLYGLPVGLMILASNFPLSALIFLLGTNVWIIGQQSVMFREGRTERAETTV